MEDHKEKYQSLQRIYEARLDHLTSSVRKVYQSIKEDEIAITVQNTPGMEKYFKSHMNELVETELYEEREEFVNRLADKISNDSIDMKKINRKNNELISINESLMDKNNKILEENEHLKKELYSMEYNSINALKEATAKCQSVGNENLTLKTELSNLKKENEINLNNLKENNENIIRYKAQIDTISTKNQALIEQLTTCQTSLSEEKRKYTTLYAESKVSFKNMCITFHFILIF